MYELKAIALMTCVLIVLELPIARANNANSQIVHARVRNMSGAAVLLPVFDPSGRRTRYEVMVDEANTPIQLRSLEPRGGRQNYLTIEPDPNGHIFFRIRRLGSENNVVFDPAERPKAMRTIPMTKDQNAK